MRRLRLAALALACFAVAGCPGGCDPSKLLDATGLTGVDSVSIAPSSVSLTVGQTQQYSATVKPDRYSDDGVTWSVTPDSVAKIDTKGVLTALAPGQAVVKVVTVATPVHSAEAAVSIAVAPPK